MSTDTITPVKKTVYDILTYSGRFIGQTDDVEYAEQAGRSGYVVKEA